MSAAISAKHVVDETLLMPRTGAKLDAAQVEQIFINVFVEPYLVTFYQNKEGQSISAHDYTSLKYWRNNSLTSLHRRLKKIGLPFSCKADDIKKLLTLSYAEIATAGIPVARISVKTGHLHEFAQAMNETVLARSPYRFALRPAPVVENTNATLEECIPAT